MRYSKTSVPGRLKRYIMLSLLFLIKKFNPFSYDGNLSVGWKNLVDYQWRSLIGFGTYYGTPSFSIRLIVSYLFMCPLLSSISIFLLSFKTTFHFKLFTLVRNVSARSFPNMSQIIIHQEMHFVEVFSFRRLLIYGITINNSMQS